MTKAPISLQELRRRIYRKAKSDKTYRFWGLFVHITKVETLEEAYRSGCQLTGGAAVAEGNLAPLHASAERPFRAVIGRLNAFFFQEGKQPLVVHEQCRGQILNFAV